MKQAYQKPALFAESFDLVEHIAGPCGGVEDIKEYFKVNHRHATDCTFIDLMDDPNIAIFTDSDGRCNSKQPGFDNMPVECYNNYTGDISMFAS